MDQVLSPQRAAELLGLSEKTVRIWLRQGRLPGIQIGRRWFIPTEPLMRHLEGTAASGTERT